MTNTVTRVDDATIFGLNTKALILTSTINYANHLSNQQVMNTDYNVLQTQY